jgi:uncharacterized membrane protein
MVADTLHVLTFAAAVLSGVMAGIFYAFSNSIMAALAKIPAPSGIAAMQAINVVIINPLFMLVFLGPALLSAVLLVAALLGWGDMATGWVIAGSVLYLVGSILVTGAFNIPRNNALDKLSPTAAESAAYWTRFLTEWTTWNHVRTAACIASMVCFVLAVRS